MPSFAPAPSSDRDLLRAAFSGRLPRSAAAERLARLGWLVPIGRDAFALTVTGESELRRLL